ncbi:unnamed protein product [Urochloa humidicola]
MDLGASVPWAELPADALSEIAGHLHDAGDLVRFLGVCRPWREAPLPPRAPSSFLPYLVEPFGGSLDGPAGVRLHSPFSTRKIRPFLRLPALRGKMIQISDASSGRVLAIGYPSGGGRVAEAELINPLTGDATPLPPRPRAPSIYSRWRSSRGVVSRSGAVVFHTERYDDLKAVLLRPGELDWEQVHVTFSVGALDVTDTMYLDEHNRVAAALCSATVLPGAGAACAMAKLPQQPRGSDRYVLEFHGELLCVDIVIRQPYQYQPGGVVVESVSVHTMQVGDEGRPRWVERQHGRDDGDHLCLFLGSMGSFAVDAREFAGSAEVTGGCAYLFGWLPKYWTKSKHIYGVYKYSFQSGTATVVDELPTFFEKFPMWFKPRPRTPPLQS